MTRRRIQPRPALELERELPPSRAELVRAIDDSDRILGGSTDRTYVITQVIEIALERGADFQKHRAARPAPAAASSARGGA